MARRGGIEPEWRSSSELVYLEGTSFGALTAENGRYRLANIPPGTYTLTLRSAANGFVHTSGELLDGNGDGTPAADLGAYERQ